MKHPKRGEVYIVDLRGATGSEIMKKRPCVVVQNDINNRHSPQTIVVPLTDAAGARRQPTHVFIPGAEMGPKAKDSVAKCENLRAVDRENRFGAFVAKLPPARMAEIDTALRESLGLA